MDFFKLNYLRNILPAYITWFRYVDDALCFWHASHSESACSIPGILCCSWRIFRCYFSFSSKDFISFLQPLNSLAPSVQFTFETERFKVTIHRVDKQFIFSIWRKPTGNNCYTHYYSVQPLNVKKSAFSSMFLRALRICNPEFLQEDIETIYKIENKHKYPRHVTEKSFHITKKNFQPKSLSYPRNKK